MTCQVFLRFLSNNPLVLLFFIEVIFRNEMRRFNELINTTCICLGDVLYCVLHCFMAGCSEESCSHQGTVPRNSPAYYSMYNCTNETKVTC